MIIFYLSLKLSYKLYDQKELLCMDTKFLIISSVETVTKFVIISSVEPDSKFVNTS